MRRKPLVERDLENVRLMKPNLKAPTFELPHPTRWQRFIRLFFPRKWTQLSPQERVICLTVKKGE
jgi:hypothetical protein